MFDSAKWIWSGQAEGRDCYSEFLVTRDFAEGDSVRMRLSADSNYAVYVNGVLADSGQYADMPNYKVYDELDLSGLISAGRNSIAVIVWYYGVASFTYYIGKPGLIFELTQNGATVLSSDESVLSRKSRRYISGKCESITMMLGLNYHVDLRESEDWMLGKALQGFGPSVVQTGLPRELIPRPCKKTEILPMVSGEIVNQGCYRYPEEEMLTRHAGDRMENAALAFFRLEDLGGAYQTPVRMRRRTGEGIYFIIDLHRETTGYLEFDVEVPEDCPMEIGWGEHLVDGRCRTAVGPRRENGATVRNFSVTAQLKQGRNHYMNPFRRLGCRYVQFFIRTSAVAVYDAGLRPVVYPVKIKPYSTGNFLRDEIYRISVHTLLQCMHEHYEDCTWREQSFYAGDSRNQMLCGYYAFGEYALPRASLRLISRCIRDDDDMLPICYPTNVRLVIPSATFCYIQELAEYYAHSGDGETVQFCFDSAKRAMDAFVRRVDGTGLVSNFDESQDFWNFYEWQPYMDGSTYTGPENYDMTLNASFSRAIGYFAELCGVVGEDPQPYLALKARLNEAIVKTFYDAEARLFRISVGPHIDIKAFSVMANTHGYLCGAADAVDSGRILEIIRRNGTDDGAIEVIPTTYYESFNRYAALIRADKERYREHILADIDRICYHMIREGATTFWETEKGQKDFGFAGSLCHGWGAMPIYYYHLFGVGKEIEV